MRLVTYNVNSVTQRLPRLLALLEEHDPDVVCLQETKCAPEAFPVAALERAGYAVAHRSAGRWAGVAVLARSSLGLDDVCADLADEPDATEARWMEATVAGSVRVASVYVPNGRALGTPAFAAKLAFLEAMARRAKVLADGPAVIAGDMNVCPADQDVWDTTRVHGATHITPDERTRLQAVIDAGFVDAYRRLEPEETGFTWWDYRAGHFHKGFGLRIDLALVSHALADRLVHARVDRAYRKPTKVRESKPSDHAPLIVDFRDEG
jgi:exodeoxyribonuclease III